MSNLNLEPQHLEDHDLSRATLPPTAATNPTKKKSGFQITSVTDSGHGRPTSILRDGEESADDLDESHASYSDVSYSKTTDADHDQESTASEDTLNISVHDTGGVVNPDGSVNHVGAVPHGHHLHLALPITDPKGRQVKDAGLEQKKTQIAQNVTFAIPKNSLSKQMSEHLESPQELPLDNIAVEMIKDRKPEPPDKKIDLPQSASSSIKTTLAQNESEQNNQLPSTVTSSNTPSVSLPQSQPLTFSATSETIDAVNMERPTALNTTSVVSATTTTKPVSVSAAMTGGKARVYKVVKREASQPTKRARGRWNWYDFSDTQAPMTGISNTTSEQRIANDAASLQTFSYTNTLMTASVVPYSLQTSDSASSLFIKDQLLSAGLSSATSSRDTSVMDLGADVLKTAIKNYAGISTKTPGDASTGDTSAAARTLKIDNKIEAAMDLVKKHLMSAVRDEVDELKEKIKDLIEENTRLKSQNKELRASLPPETASQVQASQSPPKDPTSKENGDQTSSTNLAEGAMSQSSVPSAMDHMQKGISTSLPQDGSASHVTSLRPNDHKVSNVQQNPGIQTQRPDASTAIKNPPIVGGQAGQVHMQIPQTSHSTQSQSVESPHMHELLAMQESSKPNVKTIEANFDKKNPP